MSRTLRSKERGLGRVTLLVSLMLLCVGLALMAHDIYRMMEYSNALTAAAECQGRAGSDEKAKDECRDAYRDKTLPSQVSFAFDVVVTIGQATLSQDAFISVLNVVIGNAGSAFIGFTVFLDLALSLLLASLPWAVFYCVRWISRGFDGEAAG